MDEKPAAEVAGGERLPTRFAPAEKLPEAAVRRQNLGLRSDAVVTALLDCFPEPAMAINRYRQIVLANDKLRRLLKQPSDSLIGERLGEVLDCIHAREEEGGCGTSESCRYCGAVLAMLHCQSLREGDVRECRITRREDGEEKPLDLRVWATPLTVADGAYTILAVQDITDEKRRKVLERMFFHDALNVAGGIRGLVELFPESEGEEAEELQQEVQALSEQLIEEIQSQRDLAAAERGDLVVDRAEVDARALLSRLCSGYAHHPVAEGKNIVVGEVRGPTVIRSDDVLLHRVLGNLVKNALEASEAGQTVTLAYRNAGKAIFSVRNEAVMPEEVRAQVFQRSFSTKPGTGRGVGTYSVKLLTERYLGGRVSFTSEEGKGTTFEVALPAT